MRLVERLALMVLGVFSASAVAGYWFFGLNPQNLALYPESAGFYAHSFSFFAQSQVWLSGVVLFIILGRGRHLNWLAGFVAVYVLSLSSELLGTTTGFPFGDYEYSGLLGAKWFSHVPYLIPLSWFTMALPSFVLVERTLSDHLPMVGRWMLSALLLTSWDLVLDPAMSFLVPYWLWGQAGSFYGMPWINLAGWFVTGFVLSAALSHFRAREAVEHVSSKTLVVYFAIVFALPAGMLVAAGHILLVVLVSIGIAGSMVVAYRWARSAESDKGGQKDGEGNRKSMDDRLGVIADRTDAYFENHSRSFSFASGLFSPQDKIRVCRLYAFCRMSDDIADEDGMSVEERRDMFAEWKGLVRGSYHGYDSGVKWLDDLMEDLREHDLAYATIEGLLDAIESDIEFKPLQTYKDLVSYSHGVASSVGIMMCYLFGEKEPWTQERAISLGLAMQLTNIMRDVGQDLQMGRIYLPTSWLVRFETTETDLKKMSSGSLLTDSYVEMMRDLEEEANMAYRKAWEAIPTLSWRFGPSVAVAADVYRGIHAAIRRNGYNNLTKRAYTRTPRKVWLASRALIRFSIEKIILSLHNATPSAAQHVLKTALVKAGMSWMVPFLILFIHTVALMSN